MREGGGERTCAGLVLGGVGRLQQDRGILQTSVNGAAPAAAAAGIGSMFLM